MISSSGIPYDSSALPKTSCLMMEPCMVASDVVRLV